MNEEKCVVTRYLEAELSRLRDTMEKHHDTTNEKLQRIIAEISAFKVNASADISALKTKSGVWGFIAGAIPATVVLIVLLIRMILAKP